MAQGNDVKGYRYADAINKDLADLILSGGLFALDMRTTLGHYDETAAWRNKDKALLACNDRFYLLTRLLRRRDAEHPWLFERCREVETEPFGYLDLWSRYHYKSTLLTFAGSIQGILQDPEITIGIFSATNRIARPFLEQIKFELETNEVLKEIFADVLWALPRKEAPSWSVSDGITVKRIGNPKEKTVEAFGLIDGMPTGRHFRRLVYDDLINQEHVTNPEMVQKVTERWELSTNLGCGAGTEIVACGTRYSFSDSYGLIIERGTLKPRIYPATDNGRLDGNPVFLTPEHWDKVKRDQRSTVSAQMLQNPIAGQENVFKPEWLQGWEIRPQHITCYIMGDPAGSKSNKSDRTAIAVIGVDQNRNKYFLDGFRHRMSLSERWQALRLLWLKWSRMRGVVHCVVGWEKYGLQADCEYFKERQESEGISFPIEEINWPRQGEHSKIARVERLEPDVRNGRFYLPAVVFEPGVGDCFWHVDDVRGTIVRTRARGMTTPQERITAAGLGHLVAKSIRRIDEDRRPYDVTMALIEEMLFFPFAPRDDLVDAVSRIFDMDVRVPGFAEEREAEALNSRGWLDA